MEVEKELKGERGRKDGDRTRRRKEKVRAPSMRNGRWDGEVEMEGVIR